MTSHQRRLRFLTFTVLGPANPGWDRRRVVLGSALRRLDADVVALQEVRAEDVEELLVMGGTPAQVENAAEIGIEHNLGLTRDPIGGLVQVPCIERNAMGSIKAVNAARLALHGDGEHFVSLDAVLRTMADTGRDLHEKYKETSTGGLAVNVTEC